MVEFLYVMGPDLCFQEESNRSIMLSAYQRMLYHYSQNQQLSIKILRSLYLYQLSNSTDYLRSILTSDNDIMIHPDQKIYYILIEIYWICVVVFLIIGLTPLKE